MYNYYGGWKFQVLFFKGALKWPNLINFEIAEIFREVLFLIVSFFYPPRSELLSPPPPYFFSPVVFFLLKSWARVFSKKVAVISQRLGKNSLVYFNPNYVKDFPFHDHVSSAKKLNLLSAIFFPCWV